jgi:hypothetical protein
MRFIHATVIGSPLEKAMNLRREGHSLELLVPFEDETLRRVVDVVGRPALLAVQKPGSSTDWVHGVGRGTESDGSIRPVRM